MLIPLPNLSNAGNLPLPESAAPMRDSAASGPDFSQLMQQQADRHAALRAVDQQVATQARSADATRAAAAPAATRPAADSTARPAEPASGPHNEPSRRDAAPATAPRSDSDPAATEGTAETQGTAVAPPDAPARPRTAAGTNVNGAANAKGSAATPAAEDDAVDDGALPDAAAAALPCYFLITSTIKRDRPTPMPALVEPEPLVLSIRMRAVCGVADKPRNTYLVVENGLALAMPPPGMTSWASTTP